MSDYTPSTDEVRAVWCEYTYERGPREKDGPAFDRWLESVRAEERERIARNIEAQGITARDVPQNKDWMAVIHTRKADARIAREGA